MDLPGNRLPGLSLADRAGSDAGVPILVGKADFPFLDDQRGGTRTYEGPVFYAYPEGSQPVGSKPVYRFWSDVQTAHYYTISETEKGQIIAEQAGIWTFEGIAWYAYDADSSDSGSPVIEGTEYEFSADGTAASFELDLKAYLDGREVQIDLPEVMLSPTSGTMKMLVDFDAMTTSLAELQIDSDLTQHAAVITDTDGTGATLSLMLSVEGRFETVTARGPFAIDSLTNGFSTAMTAQGPIVDEVFTLAGAVVFEDHKYPVDLTLPATDFRVDGQGTFDDTSYPKRLDVNLGGPFQWSSQDQETLLLEADLKGHTVQVYIASLHVRPTGSWLGKDVATVESKTEK